MTTTLRDFIAKWSNPPYGASAKAARRLAEDIDRDFIVIPRTNLPEVTVWDDTSVRVHNVVYTTDHKGDYRADALARLAIAEYLDAHPPVDPIDVDVLVDLLGQIPDGEGTRDRIAHHLLRSGRVTIKEA